MAVSSVIAARHREAIIELVEILEKLDPDVGARISKANHGPNHGIPSPTKRPLETAAYHAECMRSLACIIDQQLAPKKRGRPRKAS